MLALCFVAYFHPYNRCHDDSPELYCWNSDTSTSASAAAKFSSNNRRSAEAKNEASFATSSGLPTLPRDSVDAKLVLNLPSAKTHDMTPAIDF
jgi:hypothetical protein